MQSHNLYDFKAALKPRDFLAGAGNEVGLLLRVGLQDTEQPSTQQKRSTILCNKISGQNASTATTC